MPPMRGEGNSNRFLFRFGSGRWATFNLPPSIRNVSGCLSPALNGMLHAQKLKTGAPARCCRAVCVTRRCSRTSKTCWEFMAASSCVVACQIRPSATSFQLQSGFHETYRLDRSADLIPVAFHYDFQSRRVKAHQIIHTRTPPRRWVYSPDLHTLACFDGSNGSALDLETGGSHPGHGSIFADCSRSSRH